MTSEESKSRRRWTQTLGRNIPMEAISLDLCSDVLVGGCVASSAIVLVQSHDQKELGRTRQFDCLVTMIHQS